MTCVLTADVRTVVYVPMMRSTEYVLPTVGR